MAENKTKTEREEWHRDYMEHGMMTMASWCEMSKRVRLEAQFVDTSVCSRLLYNSVLVHTFVIERNQVDKRDACNDATDGEQRTDKMVARHSDNLM